MKPTQIILILVNSLCASKAANILGLMAAASPSNQLWRRSLMMTLAARGHDITVLTTEKENNSVPNYTQHVIEKAYPSAIKVETLKSLTPFSMINWYFQRNMVACKNIYLAETTRDLLKLANTTTFDLIITDLSGADCVLGFVHVFKSPPLIGYIPYGHGLTASYTTGNPHNPAYIPWLTTSYSNSMSFWQRLTNTMYHMYAVLIGRFSHIPSLDRMNREYFGEDVPSIRGIKENISLVMVNTVVGFDHPRPLLPAVVEVGGIHIGPGKTLTQCLKKPMDEAKEGFIYFSLGSNLRSDQMSAERRQVFLDAFSRLPYKVFWKWESDSLPGQPSNVIVSKWMPQRDILAHPNILLFITHNGLLSTHEAIYNGVPTVGVPIHADQINNAARSKAHGFAENVELTTLTSEELLRTIMKVVNDHRYKENARRLSKIMRDQPQSPLERAVFWTEYVIRHKGAPHLRSAAADLPLYQYLLLDVVGVLVAGVLVVLMLCNFCRILVVLAWSCRQPEKQKIV